MMQRTSRFPLGAGAAGHAPLPSFALRPLRGIVPATNAHLHISRKIGGISTPAASSSTSTVVYTSLRFPSSSSSSTSRRRLLFTSSLQPRPHQASGGRSARIAIAPRRGYASSNDKSRGQAEAKDAEPVGGGTRRRVEVNLNESVDQVAMGYLKKYGRKLVVDWPLQGLKYGALGALAVGGVGYMAASAVAQKARSLFGGREVATYDSAAAADAKKKEGGFFSRMLKSHLQEALAHEMSRTMSLLTAINQEPRLRQEMGGDVMIDMENAMDKAVYLNTNAASKHPRFEISTVRTWEYDEHWLASSTGERVRLCVQGYLDEKEDIEREALEKSERRQRARERKRMGLKPEDEGAKDKKAEKAYDWHFVHISVFFDNDSRQLILTHGAEATDDLLILPDAEWPGDAPRSGSGKKKSAYAAEALHEEDDDSDSDVMRQPRRAAQPQFIDAEVVQPKNKKTSDKKKRR